MHAIADNLLATLNERLLHVLPRGVFHDGEEKLGDTFDQAKSTWTYKRGAETITVVDGPRTVAEGFIYPPT